VSGCVCRLDDSQGGIIYARIARFIIHERESSSTPFSIVSLRTVHVQDTDSCDSRR